MSEQATGGSGRTLVGEVVSNAMDKTVAVRVVRQVQHPLYRKYLKRSTKLLAHDEGNECQLGDTVEIAECRPLSRRKSWRVRRIIERGTRV